MTKKQAKENGSSTNGTVVPAATKKNSSKKTMVVNDAKGSKHIEKFFTEKVNEDKVFHKARAIISEQSQQETFYMMDLDCVKKRVDLWNEHLPDV